MFLNGDALRHLEDSGPRSSALAVATAGLDALNPTSALWRKVTVRDGSLHLDGRREGITLDRPIHVLGGGKATLPIVKGLCEMLGNALVGGVVATNDDNGRLGPIDLIPSSHPYPSESSLRAGSMMVDYASQRIGEDLVLAVFTGGCSAMVTGLPGGISLEDKRALTGMLLGSGLDIVDLNTVRKHVSTIKGGRLAHHMPQATIVNLTVSDVSGNPLDSITDPTTQDSTTSADAIDVLDGAGLLARIPASIRRHLKSEQSESPSLSGYDIHTCLLVTGLDACDAMQKEAISLGYEPIVLGSAWVGEARSNGALLASLGMEARRHGIPTNPPCAILGCGGESTVRIETLSEAGTEAGGPNQEFAVSAAALLDGEPGIAVLGMDTDGHDGGTQWAGGLVDGSSIKRSALSRREILSALTEHRATDVLERSKDLLLTGATGTNVNDLFVVLVDG